MVSKSRSEPDGLRNYGEVRKLLEKRQSPERSGACVLWLTLRWITDPGAETVANSVDRGVHGHPAPAHAVRSLRGDEQCGGCSALANGT